MTTLPTAARIRTIPPPSSSVAHAKGWPQRPAPVATPRTGRNAAGRLATPRAGRERPARATPPGSGPGPAGHGLSLWRQKLTDQGEARGRGDPGRRVVGRGLPLVLHRQAPRVEAGAAAFTERHPDVRVRLEYPQLPAGPGHAGRLRRQRARTTWSAARASRPPGARQMIDHVVKVAAEVGLAYDLRRDPAHQHRQGPPAPPPRQGPRSAAGRSRNA